MRSGGKTDRKPTSIFVTIIIKKENTLQAEKYNKIVNVSETKPLLLPGVGHVERLLHFVTEISYHFSKTHHHHHHNYHITDTHGDIHNLLVYH